MIEYGCQRLIAIFRRIAFAFTLLPLCAAAQDSCTAGVVFGFFNGVQTTEQVAKFVAYRQLVESYSTDTPAGEPITYDLFYNDTQGFADFVETFDQRLQEHGGLLAGRFELFFSAARGEGFWWTALTSAIPSLVGFLDDLFSLSRAALMRELTTGLGTPNTGEVANRHREQIDQWAALQKKMLFFAHSQGNLFVNQAYAHALSRTEANAVKVVHVAPASPLLSGSHTLADKDLVINALRLVGAVAPNTTEIAAYMGRPAGLNGERDLVGHGLLEIYLNPALPTAGRVREHVLTALLELDSVPRRPMPPYPDFVYRDWQGGEAPAAVYAPNETSHQLQKIVKKDTVAVPWMFSSGIGWWDARNYLGVSPQQGITKRSTHYVGEGMNGYVECTSGLSLEGMGDGLSFECTYEKVPVKEWELDRQLRAPDELTGLGGVPDGTVVYLNEMTFSQAYVHGLVNHVDTPQASIEFYSGFQSRWANEIEDKRIWSEPYWFRRGALLNSEALLAHSEAFRKHEEAEYLRFQQHALLRWEYEQKRLACGSPT